MRVLVVTPVSPPTPEIDVQGVYRRLGVFVSAIGKVANALEILYFVSPGHSALRLEPARLDEVQSTFWGTRVGASLAPLRNVSHVPMQYGLGLFSLLAHPAYFPLAGREQIVALEACLDRAPDLIFVHRLAGMSPFWGLRRRLPPILLDLDDVEHRVKVRSALASPSWPVKAFKLLQAPAFFIAERRSVAVAAKAFVCSELDRRHLQHIGFGSKVVTIPNAVPMPGETDQTSPEQSVLFLGGYHYPPNSEAADRLITRIWPIIRGRVPAARLIIAGNFPEKIASFAGRPEGVEFTGLVDDLNALYRRSRLICCPLMNGGGTRLKLIEAAAFAKPMVSTTVGAEGLDFRNDQEILIRDDDHDIAEACVQLLGDRALCQRFGAAASLKARSLYDLNVVQDRIIAQISDVVGPKVIHPGTAIANPVVG